MSASKRSAPPGDVDLLAGWGPEGAPPDDLMARVLAHPRFAAAVVALAGSAVATVRSRANITHAGVDAGRYVVRLAAMWLDVRGELTLPALKRLSAASGLLSAGRARDFLRYLEHVGLVEVVEPGAGARPARYRATPAFREDWIGHLRGPIAAAAELAPAAHDLLAQLGDPAVAARFIEIQGGALLGSAAQLPREAPVAAAFYHPAGGLQVLSMLIAGAADTVAFPSRRPVEVPVTATARAIGVSPLQIKRVLRRAIALGLLTAHPGSAYALTEQADAPLRFIYAGQFVQLLIPIGRTLNR